MEKVKVPGLSVSISQKGELVYSKGFGYADLENQTPVDPAVTKFRIGSVSKTLTASGLAKLYEAGKVDLDATIEKYVPIWPDKGETITLRLLAGHLAGIRHYKGLEFMSDTKYENVVDGLGIFMNDPLVHKPGSAYLYSSYGWNLISVAMENAVTPEASFLSFMQSEVFEALEMTNTEADHADQDIENRTKFYRRNRDGNFIEAGYLKQATLNEWMKSQKTTNGEETNYGMGWRTVKFSGYTFVGHTGGSVGGITRFFMHIPSETVVAVTGNIDPLPYGTLDKELLKLFLN